MSNPRTVFPLAVFSAGRLMEPVSSQIFLQRICSENMIMYAGFSEICPGTEVSRCSITSAINESPLAHTANRNNLGVSGRV